MMTIFKTTAEGLKQLEAMTDGCWINLVDPPLGDIEQLAEQLEIPLDFLTSALDLDERARTERTQDATLIVLRVPLYEGPQADIPYITIPIGVILTDQAVITICARTMPLLDDLAVYQTRGLKTGKRNRFVLHLLMAMAKAYLAALRRIDQEVDKIEERLKTSLSNKEVLDLLKYQKSLTLFTTALKSNELTMNRLQKSGLFYMYPEDEELLEDALTEIAQAIEMTNISSGILNQMMDAFASIISNNMNAVMKFLASVTIILTIPSLIAAMYGMNVSLPGQESPYAFLVVLAGSVLAAVLVGTIFNRRRWL